MTCCRVTLGNQLSGVNLVEPDVIKRFQERYPSGSAMEKPQPKQVAASVPSQQQNETTSWCCTSIHRSITWLNSLSTGHTIVTTLNVNLSPYRGYTQCHSAVLSRDWNSIDHTLWSMSKYYEFSKTLNQESDIPLRNVLLLLPSHVAYSGITEFPASMLKQIMGFVMNRKFFQPGSIGDAQKSDIS